MKAVLHCMYLQRSLSSGTRQPSDARGGTAGWCSLVEPRRGQPIAGASCSTMSLATSALDHHGGSLVTCPFVGQVKMESPSEPSSSPFVVLSSTCLLPGSRVALSHVLRKNSARGAAEGHLPARHGVPRREDRLLCHVMTQRERSTSRQMGIGATHDCGRTTVVEGQAYRRRRVGGGSGSRLRAEAQPTLPAPATSRFQCPLPTREVQRRPSS